MKRNNKDKNEQNRTQFPKVNPQTGLTAIQEQCAMLLAAGERVSEVADKLQVSRSTIYQWNDSVTFQCFTNQLRDEVQRHTNQTLFSLAGEALSAIRQALKSGSESIRLKSAIWLLERIGKFDVGECSPFNILRKESTFNEYEMNQEFFSSKYYNKRLKELGLEDPKGSKQKPQEIDEFQDIDEIGEYEEI